MEQSFGIPNGNMGLLVFRCIDTEGAMKYYEINLKVNWRL